MKLPPPVQQDIEMRNSLSSAPLRGLRVANERRRRKEEEEVAVSMSSYERPIVKGGLRRKDNEENRVQCSDPSSVGNHSGTLTSGEEEEPYFSGEIPPLENNRWAEQPEISPVTPPLDIGLLAEAMPVAEEDAPADANDLEEAQQVDLDAIRHAKAERDSKFRRYIGLLILTIAVLAGAILTGTLVGRRNSGRTIIITEVPTLVPSMAPTTITNFPSKTPKRVRDSILELLPESTRAGISNFSSPQYEAWHWLTSHPNAPIMEDWRKIQLFAMATFYFSFLGGSWNLEEGQLASTWLNPSISECDWEIRDCQLGCNQSFPLEEFWQYAEFQRPKELYTRGLCNEKGNVTILWLDHLNFAGLQPHIPEEIALLSSLSHMFLYGKGIHATVSDLLPSELGLLTNLTQIRLDYNDLHSTIPAHIGLLTSLEVLDLGDNNMTGWLPTQLGLLSGLSVANFHMNRLTGKLPSQIGLLSELWRLSVRDNKLNGGIPTEVGQLGSLEDFWIYNNSFNYVPTQLGLLSTLSRMYAGFNLMSSIPSELGLLSNLQTLNLHNNSINGTIPTELGALTPQKLERLSLGGNRLNGMIPTEMSKLASLEFLYLNNNQFNGSLPSEFGLFQNMRYLLLSHNQLSGSLPTEMDSARHLDLSHNRFNGSLPSEIGLFQGDYLLLDNNLFSGSLPSEIGLFQGKHLQLGNNLFRGSLPSEIGAFQGDYLLLDNNLLSGSLPTEISQLSFRWLHLQNNQLSGKVPGLSLLPYHSWYPSELNLANNNVSGPIPNGTLDILDLLDIRNTSLTGTIPDEYCSIDSLNFDCSAFLCGCSCSCCNESIKSNIFSKGISKIQCNISNDGWE